MGLSRLKNVHYGWIVVFTGMLGVLASIGLARFALGMLLPSMAESLELTYSQMGFISTGNLVGYLVAVLFCGSLAQRIGPRKVIVSALVLVGVTMVLIGLAEGFFYVLVLYTLTGVGSGGANVPIMGLVAAWFGRKMRGRAAGFIVIGSSFAIVLSGMLIPFVNRVAGPQGWRISWQLLGAIVLVIAWVCLRLLVNRPMEKGLSPVGIGEAPPRSFEPGFNIYRQGSVYHLGAIYFLFGFTYVIYATFVVTALVREWGFSEATAGTFWAWVGALSLASGPVFGTLSDWAGRRVGLVTVFSFQAVSYIIVALGMPPPYLYVSIFCFGVVAWSIPSIMAAAAGDYFGAERAPQAFGFMTFIFALGQLAGPAVAGMMAEGAGSFRGSFFMSALLAIGAIGLTIVLKKPKEASYSSGTTTRSA